MASTIQARLDEESRKIMEQLLRSTGWTPSRVVREGLRLLAICHLTKKPRTIIGQGKFPSGVGDLASNKAHLRGFGKK
jgi:hypothetical protein